ncbi:hypothetical protein BLNAU_1721 [Blattamonas nauphoetae]|uniref:Uncharacterized protein n=1 Tax=Blattamonas nauphoetae TaxID=2049346 RepID=A0ABQ9YHI4_9EUKA|nr:hypothetical protein BLNAU_1721 [Blattamonas nauphoetae]
MTINLDHVKTKSEPIDILYRAVDRQMISIQILKRLVADKQLDVIEEQYVQALIDTDIPWELAAGVISEAILKKNGAEDQVLDNIIQELQEMQQACIERFREVEPISLPFLTNLTKTHEEVTAIRAKHSLPVFSEA